MRNIIPTKDDILLIEQLRKIHSSSCYNELVALSQKTSLLSRIEKEKSETILSKLIKNVLNDVALNNSLPIAPMGLLLRYIASKKMETGAFSPLTYTLLTNPTINVKTSYINTEEPVNKLYSGIKSGRIDIFAEGMIRYGMAENAKEERFCLVIENKIQSTQHDEQCKEYYRYVEKKYNNIPHRFYVYLDPKEGTADCEAFINMSYNDLTTYVLDPLLSESKHLGGKIPNDYYRDLIELIDTLQHPAEFMNNQPIALSKEYRDLLSQFYKENRDLILLAATEYADAQDFKKIENGYRQRCKYIISHPKLPKPVETNQKFLLKTLFLQYELLDFTIEQIKEKYGKIGTLFKSPDDRTTGYTDPVTIKGQRLRINIEYGRKNRKFQEIQEIAQQDGFTIS